MEELHNHECLVCKRKEDEVTLNKCQICNRYYCVDHAFMESGLISPTIATTALLGP